MDNVNPRSHYPDKRKPPPATVRFVRFEHVDMATIKKGIQWKTLLPTNKF